MNLKETISNDLKQAMLARDELKVSTLRMLTSAIKYSEIARGGAGSQASDEEVLSLVQKEIKQRQESIESFKLGKREDLVQKETQEMEILKSYLPPQLSVEEIRILVRDAVVSSGARSLAEMGKVMGILMPQIKGKANGTLVSQIVKEELGKPIS